VDDFSMNLSLMRSILEPSGYKTMTATNPHEALATLEQRSADLIVCDAHMAAQSGIDLLRAVKADARWRHIGFIIISSTDRGIAMRREAEALGVDRFIVRPIEPEALLARIGECLEDVKQHGGDPGR
jgi:CheY-like chemotaxis protein